MSGQPFSVIQRFHCKGIVRIPVKDNILNALFTKYIRSEERQK